MALRRLDWRMAALGLALATPARAEGDAKCTTATRGNVVGCAIATSLSTKGEQLELDALEGRRRAASTLLPSNPALSVAGGYPAESGLTSRPILWSASLSQELEVAGQRGRRLDVVAAEQRQRSAQLTLARRTAATDALLLYFDALAAIEEAKIAERLGALAIALKAVAGARAQNGLAAGVEAQVATATATRLAQSQLATAQRRATSNAALASLLGFDPASTSLRIEGELAPLDVPDAALPAASERAIARRAEVAAAVAQQTALERKASLYERLRIPNPTISLFAKNDWIGERSVGIGLGFPLPLPSPLGRTFAGEIAESNALALRAEADAALTKRSVRLEVAKAVEVLRSRKQQLALYVPEQIRQAEDTLRSIGEEIAAGRLAVRDALVMQQSLIDYLFAHVEAQRQLCFASVETARALGVPLEAP